MKDIQKKPKVITDKDKKQYSRKEVKEILNELGRCCRRSGAKMAEQDISNWFEESYPV